MVQVKEKEKELKFELDYIREQLKKEQDKVKQYQEQVRQIEICLNRDRDNVWIEIEIMFEQR